MVPSIVSPYAAAKYGNASWNEITIRFAARDRGHPGLGSPRRGRQRPAVGRGPVRVGGGVGRVGRRERVADPVRVLRRIGDVEPEVRVDGPGGLRVARQVRHARQVLAEAARPGRSCRESVTSVASQSSSPSPLRKTTSACARRRTFDGRGVERVDLAALGDEALDAGRACRRPGDEVGEDRGRGDDLEGVPAAGAASDRGRPATPAARRRRPQRDEDGDARSRHAHGLMRRGLEARSAGRRHAGFSPGRPCTGRRSRADGR